MAGDTTTMASPNKLSPIPHPPKKPVVGNMLSLDPNAPVQHMTRMARELGPIVRLDMTALTLDTIGLCGFDYRFNSFYREDYHPFVESLVRSLETIMLTRGLALEGLWLRNRNRDLASDVAFMNKMVDEIVAERRKNAEAAADKKDMLGAMMTGVDRATGEHLDDVNIRYQINTFLIAGHETTSGLLSCTLYALLKHPEVLRKAYEEVDRVLGPDIDAKPTYEQVTQLTYITQILKEAL